MRPEISFNQFKTILRTAYDMGIGVRVKTHTGWSKNFLHIIGFIASLNDKERDTFKGIVLSNKEETEGILINNICTISAFQLEKDIGGFSMQAVFELEDNSRIYER